MTALSLLAGRENRVLMRLKAIKGVTKYLLTKRGDGCLVELDNKLLNIITAIEEAYDEAKRLQSKRINDAFTSRIKFF